MRVPASLKSLLVDVESIRPHPENPRRGNVPRIVESLRAHGQYRPIVVQERTGYIIAGNHTYAAALELGWTEIAATRIKCSAKDARKIMIVDNRSADLGGYDEELLAELLQGFGVDLAGTGYEREEVDSLVQSLLADREGTDTEPAPLPNDPTSRLGDLYSLGAHRLLCGDSTSAAAVDALLAGEEPGLVYTDPPYGMSYRSAKLGKIEGDDFRGDELVKLVCESLSLANDRRAPGAAVYVWCTWRTFGEFTYAVRAAGLAASACIVWKKGRIGPGSAHYRPEHEFCLLCRPKEDGDHELCIYCAGDHWDGGRGLSDVWEAPRDSAYVHPTQKPTVLAERALKVSSPSGGSVLDLFGGSGSTLIAAENLNRRAYVVELDPAYCDVIVDRWERHTGRGAEVEHVEELAANGAPDEAH